MIDYTIQQKEALRSIEIFLDGTDSIFILKGYAGTGKTTLVDTVKHYIKQRDKVCQLMAPTGRAAKVLSEKTGSEATTIHKGIYELSMIDVIEGNEEEESSVQYRFPLKREIYLKNPGSPINPDRLVIVIDEASMVSSQKANNDLYLFGSGVLLQDLLDYARLDKGGKIIFVGDPAQLPPVGDSESRALSVDYFKEISLGVDSYELTDVVRQGSDSAILSNSIILRDSIQSQLRTDLILERRKGQVEDIDLCEIPQTFYNLAPTPSIDGPVIICFSNRAVSSYNTRIRNLYYPGNKGTVQEGDKLIIVRNNYSDPQRDIYNGDFATVISVSDTTEKLSGVVYVKEGEGKRTRKIVDLVFRDVVLQFEDGLIVGKKIFDNLLSNEQPDLTYSEICALVSNFKMRHPEIRPKDRDYAQALREDPYFNAIRAKYGYAITCHKAQGGEWDTTFVDFSGRTGFGKDCLRWSYTAATRARRMMYGFGLHNIPALRAKVVDIASVSSVPSGFYPNTEMVPAGPFHGIDDTPSLKGMYWQVEASLQGSGFCVLDIEHKQYREVYVLSDGEGHVYRCESIYNGAGVMRPFKEVVPGTTPGELLDLLNSVEPYPFVYHYAPENPNLQALHNRILSICSDYQIGIVNVIDQMSNYKLLYCLRTDALFAYLEVFINKFGQVTHINPRSEIGNKDVKLVQLVEAIKQ